MKTIILIISFIFLYSCSPESINPEAQISAHETEYRVVYLDLSASLVENGKQFTKGIWISQFDMHPIFRDGNKQRDIGEYRNLIENMMDNLVRDGFNTVFLQIRPNGDSMYESEIYPTSKYIAGAYGGNIEYDAVGIFLEIAKKHSISVHAWINPFRLCKQSELLLHGKGILYEWLNEGIGKRIELGSDGLLYLDPSYSEATDLIVDGAKEILDKYDFDGIHLDDYFYPTEFEFDDSNEFNESEYNDLSEFRRESINRTITALYKAVHCYENKKLSIAPAGNIYSLENGWYVDIYKWLSSDGYIDYIMPQLYYGFENSTCPFEKVLFDWISALKNERIQMIIGLSAAKCEAGSMGEPDEYAGSGGKYEWRDNKDILLRSLQLIKNSDCEGVCIFTYSSFYDPITAEVNKYTEEEHKAFCIELKK